MIIPNFSLIHQKPKKQQRPSTFWAGVGTHQSDYDVINRNKDDVIKTFVPI